MEILNLQLRHKFCCAIAHYSNRETARATFLLLCRHMLLLTELFNAELRILWTRVPTCKTERYYFCDPTFNAKKHKNRSALGKASKWALCLRFSCSSQVSGVCGVRRRVLTDVLSETSAKSPNIRSRKLSEEQ